MVDHVIGCFLFEVLLLLLLTWIGVLPDATGLSIVLLLLLLQRILGQLVKVTRADLVIAGLVTRLVMLLQVLMVLPV